MHITAIYVMFIPWPWWQWPSLRGWFSQLRQLCDVLTGVTDAGAGWRQPYPSMKTRRTVSNLFLFLIQMCWKGQVFAYGNLFFVSRYGGWVCSVTLLVLFYFFFSALPDCCVLCDNLEGFAVMEETLKWRGSCRCTGCDSREWSTGE